MGRLSKRRSLFDEKGLGVLCAPKPLWKNPDAWRALQRHEVRRLGFVG